MFLYINNEENIKYNLNMVTINMQTIEKTQKWGEFIVPASGSMS